MTDEPMPDNLPEDPTKFKIGFDSMDPEVMIIQVPIREWALDYEDGAALLHGKLREAEAVAMRTITEIRKRKLSGGIIAPGGNGNGLGVH